MLSIPRGQNRYCFQFTSLCFDKSERLLKHLVHYTSVNPFRVRISSFSIGPLCLYSAITVTLFIYRATPVHSPSIHGSQESFFPSLSRRIQNSPFQYSMGVHRSLGNDVHAVCYCPRGTTLMSPLKGRNRRSLRRTTKVGRRNLFHLGPQTLLGFISRLELMS